MNPEKILIALPEFKRVQDSLKKLLNVHKEKTNIMQKNYQIQLSTFFEMAHNLPKDVQKKEETRLKTLKKQLDLYSSNFQQTYLKQEAKLVHPLLKKIQQAADSLAKKHHYTYILNTQTVDGNQIILFVSEAAQKEHDLTPKIVKLLKK